MFINRKTMKKFGISLAMCAILFAVSGLAQDNYIPFLLKESIKKNAAQFKSGIVGSYPRHTEEFNWVTDWVIYRTIETSYTSFGEPAVIEYNQGGNRTRNLYSYNDQRQETELITQDLTAGNWVNKTRQTSTCNSSGYQLESRSEQWNGTSWDLKNGTQTVLEMEGDRIHIATSKDWSQETGSWINSGRQTYTYAGAGANFTSVVMENWENQWLLSFKMEYSWSGNQVSQAIIYEYTDNAWKRSAKYVYEFPDTYSSVMTVYTDDGAGGWTPASRNTSNYDSHGNQTLEQIEIYMADWTVYMATQYQLTYAGNNLTERITQTYSLFPPAIQGSTSTITWKNVKKEVFSNFASLSTDITLLPDTGLSVFPNPAGKQAIVRLSLLKAGSVSLSVYSMNGQKILEENITANGSDVNYLLNLNGVRPGSYLLIARDKQGNEIGKARLIRE